MQPKKEILVVEDDIAHRTMLRILLERQYAIFEVGDGAAAIEAVKKRSFDLVLMDVSMPKLSGIEALEKIKTSAPCIPVIMMTAYSSKQMKANAMKKGAHDWLTKPFDFDLLMTKIAEAVGARLCTLQSIARNSD